MSSLLVTIGFDSLQELLCRHVFQAHNCFVERKVKDNLEGDSNLKLKSATIGGAPLPFTPIVAFIFEA